MMRQPFGEQEILERAVAAFETATGLHAEVWPDPLPKPKGRSDSSNTVLDIFVDGRPIRFAAKIKTVDCFQTLGTLKVSDGLDAAARLLVAPYITEATAVQCRELRLPFIDAAGNAYVEAPGLFVYVTGKRRPVDARPVPAFRALTPAGLRIVFALLRHPAMAVAPYREIAKVAKVALGTVGDVLADLQERGHLAPENPGPRRLLAPERLQDEWVTHYPIKLRPKLKARRFTAPMPEWWRDQDIRQYHAYWGGEVAGEKLTGYLKPARLTLYVEDKPDRLILAQRLRPDANGEIEILEAFWRVEDSDRADDLAPPVVVYADLIASADPRNLETAKLIHDRHLAPAFRTA